MKLPNDTLPYFQGLFDLTTDCAPRASIPKGDANVPVATNNSARKMRPTFSSIACPWRRIGSRILRRLRSTYLPLGDFQHTALTPFGIYSLFPLSVHQAFFPPLVKSRWTTIIYPLNLIITLNIPFVINDPFLWIVDGLVRVFTDGSLLNPTITWAQRGGYGVFFGNCSHNISLPLYGFIQSSFRAELGRFLQLFSLVLSLCGLHPTA